MPPGEDAIRVQFIHGLEGSPQGTKARLLARHFKARTPAMQTGDFDACFRVQSECLESFGPDLLVGSSFGGAVAVALLQAGVWSGPTLLLAQAAERLGLAPSLPAGVPIWIVHGLRDDVVDPADSRRLAAAGDPEWVRLIEVDDDHPLSASVESGALVSWVRELAAASGLATG